MTVPYIDVSHLAPASSFFSAILQPLGLSYLDDNHQDEDEDRQRLGHGYRDPLTSLTFGFGGTPVLQIRQNPSPKGPLRLTSLVLTAPSRSAVGGFHACALRANPPLLLGSGATADSDRHWLGIDDGGVSRAVVHDLDGNRMEAVYPDPRSRTRTRASTGTGTGTGSTQDSVHYTGSSVRETQSTRQEVGRILDWNYDVASAFPRRPISSHPNLHFSQHDYPPSTIAMSRRPEQHPYPLRRSVTHDASSRHSGSIDPQTRRVSVQGSAPAPSVVSGGSRNERPGAKAEPESSASPRQSTLTNGLSTTAVVGAILGVAAGAAVTYGLVSRDKERKPRQEFDVNPMLPRRSTYPDKIETRRHSRYDDGKSAYDDGKRAHDGHSAPRAVDGHYDHRLAGIICPPREANADRPAQRTVYADVADDYAGAWPPRRMLAQRSHHSEHNVPKSTPPVTRAVDDSHDTRSRYSTRFNGGRPASHRSRSEAPLEREAAAYVLSNGDQRSLAPSRRSAVPRSSHSEAPGPPRSHRPVYDAEQESYVSAHTHRSASTARPPRARAPVDADVSLDRDQEMVMRSRAGSRATITKFSVSGAQPVTRRPPSRAPSHVSARNVALPMSGVGSSHANWDDDMESVAPSDSISCVGSKTSRRSRKHHY